MLGNIINIVRTIGRAVDEGGIRELCSNTRKRELISIARDGRISKATYVSEMKNKLGVPYVAVRAYSDSLDIMISWSDRKQTFYNIQLSNKSFGGQRLFMEGERFEGGIAIKLSQLGDFGSSNVTGCIEICKWEINSKGFQTSAPVEKITAVWDRGAVKLDVAYAKQEVKQEEDLHDLVLPPHLRPRGVTG